MPLPSGIKREWCVCMLYCKGGMNLDEFVWPIVLIAGLSVVLKWMVQILTFDKCTYMYTYVE
jgi:hypothetical protein